MKMVIISLSNGSQMDFDLEFAAGTPIGEVVEKLCNELKWDRVNHDYEVQYEGITIHPHQTLAELGLWSGSKLKVIEHYSKKVHKTTQANQPQRNPGEFLSGAQST